MLRGHTSVVSDVRFSRNGRRVLTASMDGTVRAWDASNGEILTVFCGGVGPILAACETKGGNGILAVSMNGELQRWEPAKADLNPAQIAELLEARIPWIINQGAITGRLARQAPR